MEIHKALGGFPTKERTPAVLSRNNYSYGFKSLRQTLISRNNYRVTSLLSVGKHVSQREPFSRKL